MSDFPAIAFSKCPRCGRTGGDDPNPGNADAVARDTVGNGYELIKYQGEWMCDLCKQEIEDREKSYLENEKFHATEKFLAQAGFSQTI